MTPFGEKMRALRAERGTTLKQMADALDVSSAYLSALEHGHRGRPSWPILQRIIAYFNVIWDEAEELERLADLSHPKVMVDTAGLSARATEFANLVSEHIGDLSDDDLAILKTALHDRLHRQDGAGS